MVIADEISSSSDLTSKFMKLDLVLGASRSLIDGAWDWPLHGMRCPPTRGTTGWFVWTGEFSDADDFFAPWHIAHLVVHAPNVERLLGLPPGSRFLLAPGYEDVWHDPALLDA